GSAFGNRQLFEKSWAKTFSFGFCFVGSVCTYPTIWIKLILKTGSGDSPQKAGQKLFLSDFVLLVQFVPTRPFG
ncbi:MAG: hypothetical protein ACI4JM_12415, partial [Oscillospiraceae bacterium]